MSTFRRGQSRVFWNQMHDLDVADRHNLPTFEESLDSSKDTTDDKNVTVIRRDANANESKRELSHGQQEKPQEEQNEENRSARAYSPVSQGQDSGFSDSDRSECSDTDVQSRQRRSRRRERIRRQHKIELLRVNSLCNPAHTSTPKQDSRQMEREKSLTRQHADISKTRWDLRELDGVEENNTEISNIHSCQEETIGDFLFTAELPEVENVSSCWSQHTSLQTTPSLANKTLYNNSSLSSPETSLNHLSSVRAWLCNIANDEEDESDIFLYHKSLPEPNLNSDPRNIKNATSRATSAATKLLVRADKFQQRFDSITKQLSELENVRVERELIQSIEEDAYKFLSELGAPPPRRIHQGSTRSINQQLKTMRMDIERALEPRLDFYIENVVRALEESLTEDRGASRGAIAALTALGMAGIRAEKSIARCYGIRTLLSLLISFSLSTELRCAALRALACICSCQEAIEAFAKDDGAEILADILASRERAESEKTEAIALVVQISAPWTRALGVPHLVPFADSLVRDLTDLAAKTNCSQTLLLAAAAFNYLSQQAKFVEAIFDHSTVKTLLRCVKKSSGGNVCLMEQVASLVGELARDSQNFSYLADARASVALVSFLRMRPPNLEDTYKRLQSTASAALTRMCVDPEIARQVVALGATDCLPGQQKDVKNPFGFRTKSLRLACREAAEQIDVAQSGDQFTF